VMETAENANSAKVGKKDVFREIQGKANRCSSDLWSV